MLFRCLLRRRRVYLTMRYQRQVPNTVKDRASPPPSISDSSEELFSADLPINLSGLRRVNAAGLSVENLGTVQS